MWIECLENFQRHYQELNLECLVAQCLNQLHQQSPHITKEKMKNTLSWNTHKPNLQSVDRKIYSFSLHASFYYCSCPQITATVAALVTSPCYSEVTPMQWWENSSQFLPKVGVTCYHIAVYTEPTHFTCTIILKKHFERYCMFLSHVNAATGNWNE